MNFIGYGPPTLFHTRSIRIIPGHNTNISNFVQFFHTVQRVALSRPHLYTASSRNRWRVSRNHLISFDIKVRKTSTIRYFSSRWKAKSNFQTNGFRTRLKLHFGTNWSIWSESNKGGCISHLIIATPLPCSWSVAKSASVSSVPYTHQRVLPCTTDFFNVKSCIQAN